MSGSNHMIKVTVFLNGDHVSGGKVLSFPSSATIKDLLAEASKVLIPGMLSFSLSLR